jgi:hypothetical protein
MGRVERTDRISQRKSGAWGTSSQDLLMVVANLFRLSEQEASSRPDGNTSRYVYAGIPLLLAAAHSFIIEYEGMMNVGPMPANLSKREPLVKLMEGYGATSDLLTDLGDLVEIRNEIIHPVPLPAGTPDNWPHYLRRVKQKGLLTTTGNPDADYIMMGQIASHRLFKWAIEVTKQVYAVIVYSNPSKAPMFVPILDQNFSSLFGR